MKIKIYSQKGVPVNMDNAKEYEQKFRELYDDLWEKKTEGGISIEEFKSKLDVAEKLLQSRYPMYEEVELPKSAKKWKELSLKYGCPLMLGISQETKKLIIILMDASY